VTPATITVGQEWQSYPKAASRELRKEEKKKKKKEGKGERGNEETAGLGFGFFFGRPLTLGRLRGDAMIRKASSEKGEGKKDSQPLEDDRDPLSIFATEPYAGRCERPRRAGADFREERRTKEKGRLSALGGRIGVAFYFDTVVESVIAIKRKKKKKKRGKGKNPGGTESVGNHRRILFYYDRRGQGV